MQLNATFESVYCVLPLSRESLADTQTEGDLVHESTSLNVSAKQNPV